MLDRTRSYDYMTTVMPVLQGRFGRGDKEQEASAMCYLLAWIEANRMMFGRWVIKWLKLLGKGVTTDLHDALLLEGLIDGYSCNTRRMLVGTGTDAKKAPPAGEICGPRLEVILKVLGLRVFHALHDLKLEELPAGMAPPYPKEAMELVGRVNGDEALHASLYAFVTDIYLTDGSEVAACASRLKAKGWLAGKSTQAHTQNLRRQLKGRTSKKCRHFLTLPVLAGVCAYAGTREEHLVSRFVAWRVEHKMAA